MKKIALFLLTVFLFASLSKAQHAATVEKHEIKFPVYENTGNDDYDEFVFKRDVIKFLRKNSSFPEFKSSGHELDDINCFNKDLKIWYEENPLYFDILNLRDYEQIKRFDVSCVKPPPAFDKSNIADDDYERKFQEWAAHHPDVPKIKGDDDLSKQKFEQETMEFRRLYYKK